MFSMAAHICGNIDYLASPSSTDSSTARKGVERIRRCTTGPGTLLGPEGTVVRQNLGVDHESPQGLDGSLARTLRTA
jgi:hypothetical protein